MARTPLFDSLRRCLHLARLANRHHGPPADELVELHQSMVRNRKSDPAPHGSLKADAVWTRRGFLRATVAATVSVCGTGVIASCGGPRRRYGRESGPRVVIVGAGLAGLNAAYELTKAGIPATIHEGSNRIGGRIFTASGLLAPGLTTELGGEFIDSNHADILALADELELELFDVQAPSESNLVEEAYFFEGRHHTEAEVVEAFRPMAARMQSDYEALGELVDFEHQGNASALDRMSIAEYLDRVGASGFARKLIEVAYTTEYGLDCDRQSSLNLLFLISTDVGDGDLAVFGESDERYKIRGGNQRLIDELAWRLSGRVQLEHRLIAVREGTGGLLLTFDCNGFAVDQQADFVVLTIPFTLLRDVDLQVNLPSVKRKAIAELAYGSSAKVMAGFNRRIWRESGYAGNIFTDEAYQSAWDNSRLQGGQAAGLTMFLGGKAGTEVGADTPEQQAKRLLPGLERAFGGMLAARSGPGKRFHWPSHPFTKGGYACYQPGQWTTIAGAEAIPVGNLLFAGEHCSRDFQGFMNGAAQTGHLAAQVIAKRVLGRADLLCPAGERTEVRGF